MRPIEKSSYHGCNGQSRQGLADSNSGKPWPSLSIDSLVALKPINFNPDDVMPSRDLVAPWVSALERRWRRPWSRTEIGFAWLRFICFRIPKQQDCWRNVLGCQTISGPGASNKIGGIARPFADPHRNDRAAGPGCLACQGSIGNKLLVPWGLVHGDGSCPAGFARMTSPLPQPSQSEDSPPVPALMEQVWPGRLIPTARDRPRP